MGIGHVASEVYVGWILFTLLLSKCFSVSGLRRNIRVCLQIYTCAVTDITHTLRVKVEEHYIITVCAASEAAF